MRDVEGAIDYYMGEHARSAALGFIAALQSGYGHIGHHPGSGSSRYAHELDIPGLLCWPLKKYPYVVFYVVRDDHLDVLRVLHAMRDIPEWLLGETVDRRSM